MRADTCLAPFFHGGAGLCPPLVSSSTRRRLPQARVQLAFFVIFVFLPTSLRRERMLLVPCFGFPANKPAKPLGAVFFVLVPTITRLRPMRGWFRGVESAARRRGVCLSRSAFFFPVLSLQQAALPKARVLCCCCFVCVCFSLFPTVQPRHRGVVGCGPGPPLVRVSKHAAPARKRGCRVVFCVVLCFCQQTPSDAALFVCGVGTVARVSQHDAAPAKSALGVPISRVLPFFCFLFSTTTL